MVVGSSPTGPLNPNHVLDMIGGIVHWLEHRPDKAASMVQFQVSLLTLVHFRICKDLLV